MPLPPRQNSKKPSIAVPEKKLPSITLVGVACYVIAFIMGILFATVYFAYKPVISVSELPSKLKPGAVYLVKSSESLSSSKVWIKKRRVLLSQKPFLQPIPIRDYDLNRWAKHTLTQSLSTTGSLTKTESGSDYFKKFYGRIFLLKKKGVPYFRLEGDHLHISQRLHVYILGVYGKMTLQVEGKFSRNKEDGPYRFEPHNLRIGSAHFMDKLKIPDMMFYDVLMPMFKDIGEFSKIEALWSNIDELKIKDGVMYLRKKA